MSERHSDLLSRVSSSDTGQVDSSISAKVTLITVTRPIREEASHGTPPVTLRLTPQFMVITPLSIGVDTGATSSAKSTPTEIVEARVPKFGTTEEEEKEKELIKISSGFYSRLATYV